GVWPWLIGGLVCSVALAVLGWMVLLPSAVQAKLAAATGGQFQVEGLMGDPFGGRATTKGWTLRATAAPGAPLLAHGTAAEIVASDWRAALSEEGTDTVVIDRLDLKVTEAVLAPDTNGTWRLLTLAAGAGLPYERDGKVGETTARVRIKLLRLRVETLIVRDAKTNLETPVRIAWSGEFRDVDHTRPIVAALLAAAAR
ncbi:MAG: hypothetical protein H7067_08630, partial [Burkholderiales bacterium]|nr:hypothetical protein [Opitutaceae bacterium]